MDSCTPAVTGREDARTRVAFFDPSRGALLLLWERNVMSQNPSLVVGPTADTRRRARLVLWAAGAIALLGLVGGGIASSHLTSSLSDYDAPSSAVVLAQHQIQRVTGSNPEEGYIVVVRTAAPISASSAAQPESRRWCRSSGPARRSRASLTTPTPPIRA